MVTLSQASLDCNDPGVGKSKVSRAHQSRVEFLSGGPVLVKLYGAADQPIGNIEPSPVPKDHDHGQDL